MGGPSNRDLIARLNRDAEFLARHFGLQYRAVEAERANVKRRYGICYSDGTIRIRLRHVVTRQPLKYSSLVNTLCHELAHLRHFNHGPGFKAFYLQVLERARAAGIYRPGSKQPAPVREAPAPAPLAGPAQLALF
jgi:predicted metal-dependent hydrolase